MSQFLFYESNYFTCNYAKIIKAVNAWSVYFFFNFRLLEHNFSLYWPLLIQEYLGPEIISHFVMHGTSVAEIVKNLIAVLKKKDDDVHNIFLEAMRRVRTMILEIGELQ